MTQADVIVVAVVAFLLGWSANGVVRAWIDRDKVWRS